MVFQKEISRMQAIGKTEEKLLKEFSSECSAHFFKDQIYDPKEQIQVSEKLREQWLNRKQKKLGNKTPKEEILQERKNLGNANTDFNYIVTDIFWPKRWETAEDLHFKGLDAQKKFDLSGAFKYYSSVVNEYPDYPFIYRSMANLSKVYLGFGDKDKSLELMKKAIEINPRYKFAREELRVIEQLSDGKLSEDVSILQSLQGLSNLLKRSGKRRRRKK
jgi:tetratricopeptide (TPR) repeat protein